MMKIFFIVSFLILSSVFVYPQNKTSKQNPSSADGAISRQQSAPDKESSLTADEIAALVKECGERTTRMGRIIFHNYTYAQSDIEYELDKRGQVTREKSKVYEEYPVGGRSSYVRVQLSEDGIPLSSEKIERERKRASEELLEAEKKSAQAQNQQAAAAASTAAQTPSKRISSFGILLTQRSAGGLGKSNLPIRPTDFLISHEFYAARRTMFNNRETVLLNFRPRRPSFVFDKSNLTFQEGIDDFNRLMAQFGGRIWIDAADKVIVRVEVSPVQEANFADTVKSDQPKADVPLGFEFARLPNGVWTPSRSWLNGYGRESVFRKLAVVSRALQFSDFKLYRTEVKDVEINAPNLQP